MSHDLVECIKVGTAGRNINIQDFWRLAVDCRPDEDLGTVDETKVEVDNYLGPILAVGLEEVSIDGTLENNLT